MQIGITTSLWYIEKIYSRLWLLKEYGIKYTELWFDSSHFDYHKKEEITRLDKELQKNNITPFSIHAPYKYDNKYLDISAISISIREQSIYEINKSLHIASNFGVQYAIIHPGAIINTNLQRDERLNNAVKSLLKINETAEKLGIQLAIENMLKGRFGDKLQEITNIIDKIASPNIGFCLDTGHMNIENSILAVNLKKIKNLFCVHISDNYAKEDLHNYPGKGNIDWNMLISFLKKMDFNSIFMIESRIRRKSVNEKAYNSASNLDIMEYLIRETLKHVIMFKKEYL